MRILKIHRYPNLKCECPHETFSDDFEYIAKLTEEERNIFINMHTIQYLKLICERTRLLPDFLRTNGKGRVEYRVITTMENFFSRNGKGGLQ